jgi:hypothetical protein
MATDRRFLRALTRSLISAFAVSRTEWTKEWRAVNMVAQSRNGGR